MSSDRCFDGVCELHKYHTYDRFQHTDYLAHCILWYWTLFSRNFISKCYVYVVWYAYAIPRIISLHFNRCYNIIKIRHLSTESWGKLVYHVTQIFGCRIAFCDTSFRTPKLNLKWSSSLDWPISLFLAKYTDTLPLYTLAQTDWSV